MTVIQWVLSQLSVKENAPRWAGIAVAAFSSWLFNATGVDLDGEIEVALSLIVAVVITTIVQKVATWPRSDLVDGGH